MNPALPVTSTQKLTFSGKVVDLANFTSEDFEPIDAFIALARTARWGGHTSKPYSVLQHSMACAMIDRQHAAYWLLHDIAEAYIGDVPTPLKQACPAIRDFEHQIRLEIFDCFDEHFAHYDSDPDKAMLVIEYENLMPVTPRWQPDFPEAINKEEAQAVFEAVSEMTPKSLITQALTTIYHEADDSYFAKKWMPLADALTLLKEAQF